MMRTVNQLSDVEIDTVLAALRLWKKYTEQATLPDIDKTERQVLYDIATERGGRLLNGEEIDALCEKINS